jgi:hypothetical protein
MSEFFSIGFGLLLLLLIGLVWMFDHLRKQRHELEKLQGEILHHAEQRRDTLPYLLESYRGVLGTLPTVAGELIAVRAEAREARGFHGVWQKEEELESLLETLWEETMVKKELTSDIGWLEARTDIEKETDTINGKEEHYLRGKVHLNNKLQKFPFVLLNKRLKVKE